MKQIFIILICTLVCTAKLYSQTDSLYEAHQKHILGLEQSLKILKLENEVLKRGIKIQKEMIDSQSKKLESMSSTIESTNRNIEDIVNQLGVRIDEANTSLQAKATTNDLKSRTVWGVSLFLFFAIISFVVYWLLHRRIANVAPDHSLIKTLADRITFMEMTLYKMDKGVRGYKQLSKSIIQMKDNLKANGYELVDMLGKTYSDGMKVTANFVEDEELKEGEQIITSIIKPQINYRGVMIQSAQITVSQNL